MFFVVFSFQCNAMQLNHVPIFSNSFITLNKDDFCLKKEYVLENVYIRLVTRNNSLAENTPVAEMLSFPDTPE